jgi:hypothetical protein
VDINSCGRTKPSLFWPRLFRGEKINDTVSVTFGAKYLTGMVTGVPPSQTFSRIKNQYSSSV